MTDYTKYIELRHKIHTYPELGNKEVETKETLLESIQSMKDYPKISSIVEIGNSGFYIDIKGASKTYFSDELYGIAFRTELDALPLTETSGVDYSSKNPGVAHSCGHDGHMCILTCFLEKVLQNREKIPDSVLLRFIYQPAEEVGNGATKMIEFGCLKNIKEIYAIHNNTVNSLYDIAVKAGPVMASADFFDIKITGKGGHGSMPNLTQSPITAGAEIVKKINQISSQNLPSELRNAISIGSFNSGEASNVIPEYGEIKGSIRTLSVDCQKQAKVILTKICDGIAKLNKVQISLNIDTPGTVIDNDLKLVETVVKPAILNSNYILTDASLPEMASDDFSFYMEKLPGVYINVGGKDSKHTASVHNPAFDFNDKVLPIGVEILTKILETRLKFTLN